MFDQIMDASKGKQIVMFLDYDGTLAPIVNDPERAFMSDSVSIHSLRFNSTKYINFCQPTSCLTRFNIAYTSDEKNCEKTCKVLSYCYCYWKM